MNQISVRKAIHQLAHDLRSPLGVIIAYAELLSTTSPGPLTPKQARFVAHMQTAAGQMAQMLEQAEADLPSEGDDGRA